MQNKTLTLGSLFDGSGGFPLGGLLAGIEPVWASEIEPFPIRVTTKRLPFMKHYGNVSEMDGGKIEPVDIITFGSPCQDMSVADFKLMDLVRTCTAGCNDENENEAIGYSTAKFEEAIKNGWKLLYLIPLNALEDLPEKWAIVENSPLVGKDFRTSAKTSVHVELIERHVDTIDGTPGCVYRINGDSHLAFMLYGNTIIEYKTTDGQNMDLVNNYSCACFIQQFPFKVPYPCVTTIIHAINPETQENEDYAFISDIRNISREEVSPEDLQNKFFSPEGTALYPNPEFIDIPSNEEASTKDNSDIAPDGDDGFKPAE